MNFIKMKNILIKIRVITILIEIIRISLNIGIIQSLF